ncbi:NCS2 family permease [bacterium]|nr:NCS2 family permease [bacterium]
MIEKFFRLREQGTTIRTEITAGATTFLTMAYIVVIQPLVLSGAMFGIETGLDFGAVMTATCISAALATVIMALYAKYPIVQAPGMGENFFFVLSALPAAAAAGFTNNWEVALGVVFISGILFLLISLAGLRKALINAISPSMKNGMAVGIGLFIAFLGLQNAGLIISAASIAEGPGGPVLVPGTLVKMNAQFASIDLIIFLCGLIMTAVLHVRKVRGSILLGIAGATLLTMAARLLLQLFPDLAGHAVFAGSKLGTMFRFADAVFSAPPSLAPTFFKMDLAGALTLQMVPIIVIFLFMDTFDTIGTLVGVSEQAGLMKDGELPRASRAMVSDAVGTVIGACLGTSTVTSFIESAAGVEQGGRTGLTSLTAAMLFLLTLFISPLIMMIGSYPVITAPALVIVGSMMMRNVVKIQWTDYSEAVPAFLTILVMPLANSVADGLAMGFIAYPLVKVLSGRRRDTSWLMIGLGLVLILYFVFVRGSAG